MKSYSARHCAIFAFFLFFFSGNWAVLGIIYRPEGLVEASFKHNRFAVFIVSWHIGPLTAQDLLVTWTVERTLRQPGACQSPSW